MKAIKLLAGLATLLWSTNASASNFLEYTFTGSGTGISTQVNNDVGGTDFTNVSVSYTASYFVALDPTDTLYNGLYYIGNGVNSFLSIGSNYSNGTISSVLSNVSLSDISFSAGYSLESNYFYESTGLTAFFQDTPASFFDISSNSLLPGGTFSYNFGNKFSGLSAQGTLNGFSVRSTEALGPTKISVSASSVPELPSPVPEVSTWALMLAGFALIGFAVRRRQSVKASFRYA
jgi:hypothetical protein